MPEAQNQEVNQDTGARLQEEVFAAHSAWVAGLRAQYEASTARSSVSVQPSGFGGDRDFGMAGEPQLYERFDEGLDFEEPVYRSFSDVSWQPANDELDFDSDQPVYRSLGGLGSSTGGFAVDEVDVDMPGSHEAWMQSMPPLVQRQSAFSRL